MGELDPIWENRNQADYFGGSARLRELYRKHFGTDPRCPDCGMPLFWEGSGMKCPNCGVELILQGSTVISETMIKGSRRRGGNDDK